MHYWLLPGAPGFAGDSSGAGACDPSAGIGVGPSTPPVAGGLLSSSGLGTLSLQALKAQATTSNATAETADSDFMADLLHGTWVYARSMKFQKSLGTCKSHNQWHSLELVSE